MESFASVFPSNNRKVLSGNGGLDGEAEKRTQMKREGANIKGKE